MERDAQTPGASSHLRHIKLFGKLVFVFALLEILNSRSGEKEVIDLNNFEGK